VGLSREDADDILDEEDDMESTDEYGECSDAIAHERATHKRQHTDSSADENAGFLGPSLPPIYYSIQKKRTVKG
jgi:hypothetical protein